MKQFAFSTWLITWAYALAFAQTKPTPVNSTIQQVTVFTTGAQVTRQGTTFLPAGKTQLIFKGISPYVDRNSIQVQGMGNFVIEGVTHQLNYLENPNMQAEVALLHSQRADVVQRIATEKAMLEVYNQEMEMLRKNQAIGGNNVGVKTTELREAVDFQRARMTEVLTKELEINRRVQQLDSTLRKMDGQLRVLNHTKSTAISEIVVNISAKEPLHNVPFSLSYYVVNASWTASYDVRVQDIASPLALTYKANVQQATGEDWKAVKLTLSTGDPTENATAPTLSTWNIGFYNPSAVRYPPAPIAASSANRNTGTRLVTGRIVDAETGEPLIGATITVEGANVGTITNMDGHFSFNVPNGINVLTINYTGFLSQNVATSTSPMEIKMQTSPNALQDVVVSGYGAKRKSSSKMKLRQEDVLEEKANIETSTSYQPTTVNFTIETPYTVLSDGKEIAVEIKTHHLAAIYEYITVPKLSPQAFLTAGLVNWQALNLLPGEANLFFEGAFLGKSMLDVLAAEDTLLLSLGKDKSIVVERKKVRSFTNKQFIGGNKTEERRYEISIRNNKPVPIQIVVKDQFPLSTHKDIVVEEEDYKDAALDKETKILTWRTQIAPKQERKYALAYVVKYPKGRTVLLE